MATSSTRRAARAARRSLRRSLFELELEDERALRRVLDFFGGVSSPFVTLFGDLLFGMLNAVVTGALESQKMIFDAQGVVFWRRRRADWRLFSA